MRAPGTPQRGGLMRAVRDWLHRARLGGREFALWYDAGFRLPLPSLHRALCLDARRADEVTSYLLDSRIVQERELRRPVPVAYSDIARVHGAELVESLQQARTLAHILGVDPEEVVVTEVLHTVRLGCGATLEAARYVLKTGGVAVNLLGGFHHAGPDRVHGLSLLNDIAIAVAALRHDGWTGRVAILDLDAHPPDGTAACLAGDRGVFIGSLSGSRWEGLAGVDETVLPGAEDAAYLGALDELLVRVPRSELAFVVAGGDVLTGDRLGALALTLDGARRRDLRVAQALRDTPCVWLSGGGYHQDAWRVLSGTVVALRTGSREAIAPIEPLHARFARVAGELEPERLGVSTELTMDDVLADLRVPTPEPRLLGYYTVEGVEHVLERYGVLEELRRRGFDAFRVTLDREEQRDRVRVHARKPGGPAEHLIVDGALGREEIEARPVLYVEWLMLQDPTLARKAVFPGQDHPGLGIAHEIAEMLIQMARRLRLDGLAFRPSWYHTAYAWHDCRFLDEARQDRFVALQRDTRGMSPLEVSRALEEGRVRLNDEVYKWEADPMVHWLEGHHEHRTGRADRYRFSVHAS